jgi:type II secretory pathway pseudopilin PulG
MKRLNKNGYTILEIIFAAALLALVAAGIGSMMTMVSSNMETTVTNQDEYNIMNQIRTMFESEQACRLALGGPTAYDGTVAPFPQRLNPVQPTDIVLYQPVANDVARPLFLDPASSTGGNKLGHWIATAITIRPVSGMFIGAGPYAANVTVTLTRANDPNNHGYISVPNYLMVKLDATRVVLSCFPNNYGTDGQPSPICAPPYWAPSTTSQVGASAGSSGPYLNCRKIKCLPTETPVGGWDSYGNILCN